MNDLIRQSGGLSGAAALAGATFGHQDWFYICFVVGQVSDAELQAAGVPMEEHTWSHWADNGDGTHTASCADCGQIRTEPHRWGEPETLLEPTEAHQGTLRDTCLDCSATRTEQLQYEGTAKNESCFNDVDLNAYYMNAVLWAMGHNVTNGTSATTFSPNATCTRAQVVTFLWRTEGMPEPASTGNPFTDVAESFYFKPVLWAVEKQITNGMSATTFAPNNSCTRGQNVTFLYRDLAG